MLSSTSIRVTWSNENDQQVTGFLVVFSPAAGDCDSIQGGNVTLGREASSHTLSGLEEFVAYDVTVHSIGAEGVGLPSPSVQRRTQNDRKLSNYCSKVEHLNKGYSFLS